jgi:hypothetical protein
MIHTMLNQFMGLISAGKSEIVIGCEGFIQNLSTTDWLEFVKK